MILFQINSIANSGSTGRIAENIAKYVQTQGWQCYTAYGRWCNPSKTHLIRIGNKLSVYFHYFLSRVFGLHGLASKHATRSLIKEIERIHPDIIHLHNIHGYYLNYPLLFQFLSTHNYPVVWTLHDCWAYTGHCSHYTSSKCSKWLSRCYKCPNLSCYPVSFIDNSRLNFRLKSYYFNMVHNIAIVPVSNWLAKELHKSFLKNNRIIPIPNGVDTSIYKPIDSHVRDKYSIGSGFMVLAVATWWTKAKGFEDYIQIANLVDKDVIIVMVGVSPKQKRMLPSNIIGIPRTENITELVQLYSAADIFVNFSIEESYGLTTAESLSCGTPVVVYNSTACPDIVTPDVGFIVTSHNLEEANCAINKVKVMGKTYYTNKCRQYAIDYLDDSLCYGRYLSLYNELLTNEDINHNCNL